MSIATSLTALQQAKTDIASAITEMGGTVNPGDGMTSFADDIKTIPKGGEGFVRDPEAPNLELLRLPGRELSHGSGYNVIFVSLKIDREIPSTILSRFSGVTPVSLQEVSINSDGTYSVIQTISVDSSGNFFPYVLGVGWKVLRIEVNSTYSDNKFDFYNSNGVFPFKGLFYETYIHAPNVQSVCNGYHIVLIDSAPTKANLSCAKMQYIEFDHCDFSNSTTLTFANSWSLQEINLSGYDFSHVTSINGLFSNCASLKYIDLSGCDFSSATNLRYIIPQQSNSLRYVSLNNIKINSNLTYPMNNSYLSFEYADFRFDLKGTTFMIDQCRTPTLMFDSDCECNEFSFGSESNSIVELIGFPHANGNVNVSGANGLTVDHLMLIINQLNPVQETKTLNLGSTNMAKLTSDQIAIAQDKGWTVT